MKGLVTKVLCVLQISGIGPLGLFD